MRLLAALAVAALVVTGCGDDDADVAADATTTTSGAADAPTTTAPAAGPVTLEAEVPAQVPAGAVTWTFDAVNTGDEPVTLTFPSGQEGDARLIDDGGDVVHTWSAARSFIQVISEVELAPGERYPVVLDDDLSGIAPGTYTLELTLTVQDPPPPLERQVEVVEG